MGWTRCICCENVRHDFVAWTFFTNCSSSAQIAPSFVQYRNDPKCTQTLRNKPKKEFIVQSAGPGAFVAKLSDTTSWNVLFSVMSPVQPKLHLVSYCNETIPDAPKHYETQQNMNLGSNAVDLVRSLRKCSTWLRGTNFFHLLHQFSPNSTEFRKVTKRSQMHPNTTKLTRNLGSNGVDQVRSLWKCLTRLRGMNFFH